ncbi:hypothetical protein [Microvirga puerhi]|uniref:Transposase n=1 Tax=Microvirga puerhi TaxID=2876078 RepID=A0ABS7VI88_9HYPH|nr:hypothetical protein [Microvirga puerhi]MBZ6074805.1 hypothetical protein [Microvirga puerhi]
MTSHAAFSQVLTSGFDHRALREIRLAIRIVQMSHPTSHLVRLALVKLSAMEAGPQ